MAVVLGGSGVLGGATARALGREGAKVAISYRGGKDAAMRSIEAISAAGGTAHAGYVDVTDQTSIDSFVNEAAERYGGIDVLVNAFGRIDPADAVRFADIDPDAWDMLFKIDVRGTYLACRSAVPHIQRRGKGAIVNFSGSYGNGVNQENLVNSVAVQYCAAKGAIRAFTASLARDLAPTIRVNAVSPGPIEANWEADWKIPKEHIDEAIAMTPLKRMGQPDEIAETVLFLASDGGGYVTGQIVQVDGGWVLAG